MTALSLPDQALRTIVRGLPDNGLAPQRDAALARFLDNGFPTTRAEDWKYTDLGVVADIGRQWLEHGTDDALEIDESRGAAIRDSIDAYWLIIANGRLVQDDTEQLPSHITVSALSSVSPTPSFDAPLADLNTALLSDGLHISVAADGQIDRPLGLMIIDQAASVAGVSQARIVIDVNTNAHLDVVEVHGSQGDAQHYANSIIEISLDPGASLEHVRLQDRQNDHTQTHRMHVVQAEHSSFRYSSFDFGGRLIRNDIHVDLAGREAIADIAGLYIGSDDQHIDNHVRVDHQVGPATSSQQYRGVLGGRCKCVWNGKAIVQAGADGTDAEQGNHNLLLSEFAEIDAKPELEIYADEVKCSHGTTVGQLDEDALFYLRSRGLDKREAKNVLTHAFGAGIIAHVRNSSLVDLLTEMVEERQVRISDGDQS